MRKDKSRLTFIILPLLLFLSLPPNTLPLFSQPVSRPPGLTIVAQDRGGVDFTFEPRGLNRQTVEIGGVRYSRIIFDGSSLASEPGHPELPARTLVFAVPPGAEVRVEVRAELREEWKDVNLIPVPSWKTGNHLPEPEYRLAKDFQKMAGWFPATYVSVEAPGMLGDVRVVRVHLFPVRYLAAEHRVEVAHRLDVRLRWVGGSATKVPVRPEAEAFYRRAVANFSSAKEWLSVSPPRLQKRKDFWLGGPYYKISVDHDGIYRITGKFLKDHGIDIASIDPRTLKVFNNGGRPLPQSLDAPRPDGLIENAILVSDGGDGKFNEDDYLLFYGRGVNGWEFENGQLRHKLNPYTFTNIYWLTFSDGVSGKRMAKVGEFPAAQSTLNTFTDRRYFEDELRTLHSSGLVWFGPEFNETGEKTYLLDFQQPLSPSQVSLLARVYGASTLTTHRFSFELA
ncbi:MAG TPA: hypothetical protein ENJ23_03105, partial [Bacteroidetes bacterium]|nr:hypothetical protein [Bacteroidota bacterium]